MGKSAMIKVQVINKEGTIIAEAAGTKEVNLPVHVHMKKVIALYFWQMRLRHFMYFRQMMH